MDKKSLGVILFICGATYLIMRRRPKKTEAEPIENAQRSEEKNPQWDKVDEASWESFPSSDPPAYR
jgi:hypothetical protein